jgi:CRP-like cAMP-binding protein
VVKGDTVQGCVPRKTALCGRECEKQQPMRKAQKKIQPSPSAKDPVQEASEESFPASDAPSFNAGHEKTLPKDAQASHATKNMLLERLPRSVLDRIRSKLIPVTLKNSEIIHKPGEKIVDLYFPTTCMISVTVAMRDGRTVEAGAIGSREVAGINAFMGGREITQTEYIVQIPGQALKISAKALQIEFNRNTELRDVLLRYTQAFLAQVSQNVACNRLHDMDQRIARWILEVRDRVQADEFPLTHEFMAEMLGIRRASVSDASMKLKDLHIIEARRGSFKILDVKALQKNSCECYSALKAEYRRLLDATD